MNRLIALLFIISLNAFGSIEPMEMKVLPGPLHKGGHLTAHILQVDETAQLMKVELDYEVIKKPLVPVPSEYLKGKHVEAIPASFQDERGYIELERLKKIELSKAVIEFAGRISVGGLENGYKVRIITKNGKSVTELHYHPQLAELGWGRIKLTMHTGLPVIGNYTLEAQLK